MGLSLNLFDTLIAMLSIGWSLGVIESIIFFFRFGVFIVITVGYSFVFALLGVPSMMSLFGPQGNEGNLLWFFRNKPRWLADRLDVQTSFPDLDEYNRTHDCCGRERANPKPIELSDKNDGEWEKN